MKAKTCKLIVFLFALYIPYSSFSQCTQVTNCATPASTAITATPGTSVYNNATIILSATTPYGTGLNTLWYQVALGDTTYLGNGTSINVTINTTHAADTFLVRNQDYCVCPDSSARVTKYSAYSSKVITICAGSPSPMIIANRVPVICSGNPVDIDILRTGQTSPYIHYLVSNTTNVTTTTPGFYPPTAFQPVMTNLTSSSQIVNLTIWPADGSCYGAPQVVPVTVLPVGTQSGTHCSVPAAPTDMPNTGTYTYYKGSVIQLWAAQPAIAVDDHEWYRVLGTDTTLIGYTDTMTYIADTTCQFLARAKNYCSCTDGTSGVYYSAYSLMAVATVINVANYPTYKVDNDVAVICSGQPTNLIISASVGYYSTYWARNNLTNVSGLGSAGAYNGGSMPITLTNNTSVPQTVRLLFHMNSVYNSTWVASDYKSIYVTVLPSTAPSGNHCYALSVPKPFLNWAPDTRTYCKGSHIQILADTTVLTDSLQWYKVVGLDTTYAGQGYSIAVTVDTPCQYIARNVNVCNCSTQSLYYSPWVVIANYSVTSAYAPKNLRMTNYMPTIASGTQMDILPSIDSGAFNIFYFYRDNANVSGTLSTSSWYSYGAFGLTLTNTTSVPQLVRFEIISYINNTAYYGNTLVGYVTVLPASFTAPAGNHCSIPSLATGVGTNICYVKGATVNLDVNKVYNTPYAYTRPNVDSLNWYKTRWPGDTSFIGNAYPVNTVMDTPALIYTVSENVCYWSDSSKHIYPNAPIKALTTITLSGTDPSVTLTNNAPYICNGQPTNIQVSSAHGNTVYWVRDNAPKVIGKYYSSIATNFPATVSDTLTDTTTIPQQVIFDAYSYTTISSKTCWGSSALTSVNVYPSCGVWANNSIAIHPAIDSICSGDTATLVADTLPCNGGTRYVWSTGDTTKSIRKAISGTYTVTATNYCGCSVTASAVVVVRANPLTVTKDTICAGTLATMTATGGIHYIWSNGDTTASFTTGIAGTYTVTVTNASGCTANVSGSVTVNASPNLAVNSDTVCSGVTATLTATGGTGYLWSTAATTASITTGTAGIYTVTATNASGCTATASGTVTVNANPNPTVNNDTVCSGAIATLTATGGTSYLWNTGATTAIISTGTAGTYTVTATNVSGCTATASGTVIVNVNPIPTVNNDTVCSGVTATLTATGGTGYLWSTGATTASITTGTAGTYTVTVTNASGCTTTASGTVIVNVNPIPTVNNDTVCSGATANLTATGGISYLWSTGDTISSTTTATAGIYTVTATNASGCTATASGTVTVNANPSPTVNSVNMCNGMIAILNATGGASYVWSTGDTYPEIEEYSAGTYTVTATNAYGCSATASGTVAINPDPAPTVNNASICIGANATLTATGGATYIWNTGDVTASINASVSGTYTVTATNTFGCTGTASGILTVRSLPNTPFVKASQSVCSTTSHTFIVDSIVVDTLGNQIEWSPNQSFDSSIILSSVNASISIVVSAGNTDTIWIRSRDSLTGCVSGAVISILAVNNSPLAHAGIDTFLCSGFSMTLGADMSATGGTPPYIYYWTPSSLLLDDSILPNPMVDPITNTSYILTVHDSKGCIGIDTISVTVHNNPNADAGDDTLLFSAPVNLQLGATQSIGGTPPYAFQWIPSLGLNDSSLMQPTASVDSSMVYTLVVTDSNGCRGIDTIAIKVFIPSDSAFITTLTDTLVGVVDSFSIGHDTTTITTVFMNTGLAAYNDSLTIINTNFNCPGCIGVSQVRVYIGASVTPVFTIDSPSFPIVTFPIIDSFWETITVQEDLYLTSDSCLLDSTCNASLSLDWKAHNIHNRTPQIPIKLNGQYIPRLCTPGLHVTYNAPQYIDACVPNQFSITVNNCSSQLNGPGISFDLAISVDPSIIANSTISAVSYSDATNIQYYSGNPSISNGMLILSFYNPTPNITTNNLPANTPETITFTITPNCNSIPNFYSVQPLNNSTISVYQGGTAGTLSPSPYTGNLSLSLPNPNSSIGNLTSNSGLVVPNTLGLQPESQEYPFLTPAGPNCTQLNGPIVDNQLTAANPIGTCGNNSFTAYYINSGSGSFAGQLQLNYSSIYTQSGIQYFDPNYDIALGTPSISFGSHTLFPNTAGIFDFSGTPILAGECITVTQPVTLNPNACVINQIFENNISLNWGCSISAPNGLCQSTYPAVTVELTSGDAPAIQITRNSPAPNIAAPWEQVWDGDGCSGELWDFTIENGSCGLAKLVNLGLSSYSGNSFTKISNLNVVNSNFTLPNPSFTTSTSTGLNQCGNSIFEGYSMFIGTMQPGQWLEISFNTTRECPSCVMPGTGVNFDDWDLGASYIDNCNNGLNAVKSIGVEQYGRTEPDLGLQQVFMIDDPNIVVPNTTTPPMPSHCANSQPIQITNLNFTSSVYGRGWDIDPLLFCGTGYLDAPGGGMPDYVVGTNPQGMIAVTVLSDGFGTNISVANGITIQTNGGPIWSPTSSSPLPAVVGPNYNGFDGVTYYFKISDLGLSPNTSEQFNTLFQGSTTNFILQGCCSGPVPNPQMKIITSFIPYDFCAGSYTNCTIPLAEQDFTMVILCPGCVIPGMNVNSSTLTRTTVGYMDLNNDGVPNPVVFNSNGQAIPEQITLHGPDYGHASNYTQPLNLSGSIAGDHLISASSTIVFPGEHVSGGFTLTDWQNYWSGSSATWIPGQSGPSGQPGDIPLLSDLIYQQDIQYGDFVNLNLTAGNCGYVTLRRAALTPVTVQLTQNSNAWKLISGPSFVCHLTAADFGVGQTGFLGNDVIDFYLNYQICGNPLGEVHLQGVCNVYLMANSYLNPTNTWNPNTITYANAQAGTSNSNVTSYYTNGLSLIPGLGGPVISQIYTTGGTGSTFNTNFVELYNPGNSPYSLSNRYLVYIDPNTGNESSASLASSTTCGTNAQIPANGYYLIQVNTGTSNITPSSDCSINLPIGTNGTLVLATTSTINITPPVNLASTPNVIDAVGYGSGSHIFPEGAAATAPSASQGSISIQRLQNGNQNSNRNNIDFADHTVLPRNSNPSNAVIPKVRINEIGYNSTLGYSGGFIELYNPASSSLPSSGNSYSLWYTSNSGANWSLITTINSSSAIGSNSFYLVGSSSGSPSPDNIESIILPSNATIALMAGTNAPSGCPSTTDPNVIDLVGYGTTSCSWGAPTPALGNSGVQRNSYTWQNGNDFSPVNPANPLNSSSYNTAYGASPVVSPNANAVFECQGCGNSHYVYPIVQSYKSQWINGGGCTKQLVVDVMSKVNAGFVKVFPNEFRPMPAVNLNSGLSTINGDPFGLYLSTLNNAYTFTSHSVQTIAPHYSGSFSPNADFMSAISYASMAQFVPPLPFNSGYNGWTINTANDFFTVPAAYNTGLPSPHNIFNVDPQQPPIPTPIVLNNGKGLLVGDEYFEEIDTFNALQSCASAAITVPQGAVQIDVSSFINPESCGSPTDIQISPITSSNQQLSPPDPTPYAFMSPAQYSYSQGNTYITFQMDIDLTDQSNYPIPDLYLYLNNALLPPGMVLNQVATSNGTPLTFTTAGNYSIYSYPVSNTNPLNTNSRVLVNFTFEIVSCCVLQCVGDIPPPTLNCNAYTGNTGSNGYCLNLPVYYAWDCNAAAFKNSLASSLTNNTLPSFSHDNCFNTANNFVTALATVNPITVAVTKSAQPNSFTGCSNNMRFSFCIYNHSPGGIGNLTAHIYLPPGANICGQVSCQLGTGSSVNMTAVNTGNIVYDLVEWTVDLTSISALSSTASGINATSGGICLTYSVCTDCNFILPPILNSANEFSLPMDITGDQYCSSPLSLSYPNMFTFQQTPNQQPCFGLNPITLDCNNKLSFSAFAPISTFRLTNLTGVQYAGGFSPFSFRPISNYSSIGSLPSGQYKLEVWQNGGTCSAEQIFWVYGPLNVVSTPTVAPACDGPNGSITLNIQGGQPASGNQYDINYINTSTGVTGSLTNQGPNPMAVSSSVTMTESTSAASSVGITASDYILCSGQPITFTATPLNGGASPTIQWYKNGSPITGATGITYTGSLATNDYIWCTLTPSAPCNTSTVISNSITYTANSTIVPSVSISTTAANPVCPGEPVTFTAVTNDCGANPSYQWEVNGSTQGTNSPTFTFSNFAASDVVNCIVTSHSPCASPATATSNSITVTLATAVFPALPTVTPSVSISPSSASLCRGSSTTFTAIPVNGGPSPTYQWSVNGTTVPNNNGPTYTTPDNFTNYSVTCTMISNSTCVMPYSASNGAEYTISGLNAGTYTITVSNPGNPSCPITTTATVTNNCCLGSPVPGSSNQTYTYTGTQSNPVELSNFNFSYLSNGTTGLTTTIVLNGYITVSEPVTILNCPYILMGPQAHIIIQQRTFFRGGVPITTTGSLTLINSTLQACNDMWQGITVNGPNCTLNTYPSTYILDAYDAIEALSPGTGTININGTYFYRDFEGITIHAGSANPLWVWRSHFEFNTAGLYPNNYFAHNSYNISTTGQTPYYGIGVIRNPSVTINGDLNIKNTFEGLNNGINSIGSSIYARNNHFLNIQPDQHYGSNNINGMGISATSQGSSPNTLSAFVYSNDFNSCQTGMQSLNIGNTSVYNNTVEGTGCVWGFIVQQSSQSSNNFYKNTIRDVQYGIALYMNPFSDNNVQHNIITTKLLPSNNAGVYSIGIFDYEYSGANSVYTKIWQNNITGGRDGVLGLNLSTGSTISDNVISIERQENINGWEAGIHLVNSNNTQILYNCIRGNGGNYVSMPNIGTGSPYYQKGIALETSQNATIYGNFCSGTEFGQYYQAWCPTGMQNIHDNEVETYLWGVGTYENGPYGFINQEIGLSSGSGYAENNEFNAFAYCGGGISPNAKDLINFTDNGPSAPILRILKFDQCINLGANASTTSAFWGGGVSGPSPSLMHFYYNQLNTNLTYTGSNVSNNPVNVCWNIVCSPPPSGGDDGNGIDASAIVNIDSLIATGNVSFGEFPDMSSWITQRVLYRKLMADGVLRDSTPILTQFYDSILSVPIGKLEAVRTTIAQGIISNTAMANRQLFNYIVSADTIPIDSMAGDSVYFSTLIDSAGVYVLDSMSVLYDSLAYTKLLQDAASVNGSISSSLNQESNEKQINTMFMNLLTGGVATIDSPSRTWIQWLAGSCPLVEGDAVYLARAMVPLWTAGPVYIDDVALCHPDDKKLSVSNNAQDTIPRQKPEEMFKFIPVPASRYLKLMYSAYANFTVRIYTVTGQKMTELNIQAGKASQPVNIDAYTDGMYLFEIVRDKEILKRGTLSIMK